MKSKALALLTIIVLFLMLAVNVSATPDKVVCSNDGVAIGITTNDDRELTGGLVDGGCQFNIKNVGG